MCDITPQQVLESKRLWWPQFEHFRDGYFLARAAEANRERLFTLDTTMESEWFFNHEHILGYVKHKVSWDEHTGYDDIHPDMLAARRLGKLVAECWAAKLAANFPGVRFRIYYSSHDEPTVRFHALRDGEIAWINDQDWMSGPGDNFVISVGEPV